MATDLEELALTVRLIERALAEGGAVYPDEGKSAAGLLVVGVSEDLGKEITLARSKIIAYFKESSLSHGERGSRAALLEQARSNLWKRSIAISEEEWKKAGRPSLFEKDATGNELDAAWESLNSTWLEARRGAQVADFPKALRRYRTAFTKYLEGRPPR